MFYYFLICKTLDATGLSCSSMKVSVSVHECNCVQVVNHTGEGKQNCKGNFTASAWAFV